MLRSIMIILISFISLPSFAAGFLSYNKDAKVQMTIYGDMECPWTTRMMKHVPQLAEEFGSDLTIQFAHLPLNFHPHAQAAAVASQCAKAQGVFKEFIMLAFAEQKRLINSGDSDEALYREWAKTSGVQDLEAFSACLSSEQANESVLSDLTTAQALGLSGTPMIYIDGQSIYGAYPYEDFAKVIREKLDE